MSNITEIIPDDLPEWAIKAMAEGQLFTVMMDRINKLESSNSDKHCMTCQHPMSEASTCNHPHCENRREALIEKLQQELPAHPKSFLIEIIDLTDKIKRNTYSNGYNAGRKLGKQEGLEMREYYRDRVIEAVDELYAKDPHQVSHSEIEEAIKQVKL